MVKSYLSTCIICGEETTQWVVYDGQSGLCKCRACSSKSEFITTKFGNDVELKFDRDQYFSTLLESRKALDSFRANRILSSSFESESKEFNHLFFKETQKVVLFN